MRAIRVDTAVLGACFHRPPAVDAFKTNCILGKRAPDRIKTRTLLFLPGEAVGWLMHRASCESVGEALIKKLQHLARHSFPLARFFLLAGGRIRNSLAMSGILEPVRPIELDEIHEARKRIAGTIVRTPVVRLELGPDFPDIRLKLENLQPINAYKLRGAA